MFQDLWRNQLQQCFKTCGVISYGSGWRKDVVNQYLVVWVVHCVMCSGGPLYMGLGGSLYMCPGGSLYMCPGGSLFMCPGGSLYMCPGGSLYMCPGGSLYMCSGGSLYMCPGGSLYMCPGGSLCACVCLRAVEVEPDQYYSYFLDLIKNLMDCSIESSQYEDTLREMYGINSYTAFTMDKQVQQIVRTVSAAVTCCLGVVGMVVVFAQSCCLGLSEWWLSLHSHVVWGCQNGGCLCTVMLSGVVGMVVVFA